MLLLLLLLKPCCAATLVRRPPDTDMALEETMKARAQEQQQATTPAALNKEAAEVFIVRRFRCPLLYRCAAVSAEMCGCIGRGSVTARNLYRTCQMSNVSEARGTTEQYTITDHITRHQTSSFAFRVCRPHA